MTKTVLTAVYEWLEACAADGLSSETIKGYRSRLMLFSAWLISDRVAVDFLTDVTVGHIRAYIGTLRERERYTVGSNTKPPQGGKLRSASVAAHIIALHTFWGWCAREYEIANPMKNIKRPRTMNNEVKAIAPSDFVRLFEQAGKCPPHEAARDRAFLAFMADSGCRLGGVASLRVDALDLDVCRAHVIEKGSKRRVVVFTRFTADLLRHWLALRVYQNEYVFTLVRYPYTPLTKDGLYQIIKRLKRRAGVTGHANPHSFRHRFAIEYVKNGGDVVTLAKLLGHTSVDITSAYYAIFSEDELAELHGKYSPLKGMVK